MIKKSLAAFILLISIVSCKKEASKTFERKVEKDTTLTAETKEDLFKPIDTACSTKNRTEDYIAALQWYQHKIEKEIAQNSPEQNDKLYEDYSKIRDKYTGCLSENLGKVLNEYVNYYDSESDSYKFPENVKKLSVELKKGDLEFTEIGEGYTEIWSVPNHYFSVFKNKVTPDYNTYIEQLSKESEGLYSADAGLIISWKELGERTIFWENFIKKYPKSRLISRVKEMYNNYLYDYLFGMDNTPTHEHSDGTLYDENRQEFDRMIKKYPNSNVAKKSKELMSLFDAKVPEEEIHKRINIEREY
jgi:TolA-binding protein